MATWRKRSKSGGITRTSTSKGWTSSTSYGAGKKNGLGYRVTTTHRADGKTVVRTTERGGQGWYKTTQKTLSSRDPYRITKRDLNKLSSDSGSLFGDLADLIGGIVNVFTNNTNNQPKEELPKSSEPSVTKPQPTTESVDKYKYKLQYTTDGTQWYNCQSSWDVCDSLKEANERLSFKQQGTTVNKYRIVKIDQDGWAEPL